MKTHKMVSVSEVAFEYPEKKVLEDITLTASPRTITTLAGPNGCGKTTLLRLISGHMKPKSGTVFCGDISVPDASPADIARVQGYVPQSSQNSFPFSVLDVVLCGRMPFIHPWQQPSKKDISIAQDCLCRLGIEHLSESIYTRISGGERQMVMLARAICQQPTVLLLDEPTSSLDLKNQVQVLETVRKITDEDEITVIMTLHDPNHALLYSDRIVLMHKVNEQPGGIKNVLAIGTPAEVMTVENLLQVYGIRVDLVPYRNRSIIVPYLTDISKKES